MALLAVLLIVLIVAATVFTHQETVVIIAKHCFADPWLGFAALGVLLALAFLTHRLFEKIIDNLFHERRGGPKPPPPPA